MRVCCCSIRHFWVGDFEVRFEFGIREHFCRKTVS